MTELLDALKAKDEDKLLSCLSEEVDLSELDSDGQSALHIAASLGELRYVHLLLAYGGDPNLKNKQGILVLSCCPSSRRKLCSQLLDKATTIAKSHQLCLALEAGNQTAAQDRIAEGADMNQADWKGVSPLSYAVRSGKQTLVDWFLSLAPNLELAGPQAVETYNRTFSGLKKSVVEAVCNKGLSNRLNEKECQIQSLEILERNEEIFEELQSLRKIMSEDYKIIMALYEETKTGVEQGNKQIEDQEKQIKNQGEELQEQALDLNAIHYEHQLFKEKVLTMFDKVENLMLPAPGNYNNSEATNDTKSPKHATMRWN